MSENIEIKIKTAIDTANSETSILKISKALKELKSLTGREGISDEGFKKLEAAINSTSERLSDMNDRFKTLKGSGVDRLKESFSLLTEGFETFNPEKISTAFKGVGAAMNAIPIFLLIEGIKQLVEHFGEVVEFAKSFTASAKEEAKALRELNQELNNISGNLTEMEENQVKFLRDSEQRNKLAIEGLKQKGASENELNKAAIKGAKEKADYISKYESKLSKEKIDADAALIKAQEGDDEKALKAAQETSKRANDLYQKAGADRISQNNSIELTLAQQETERIIAAKKLNDQINQERVDAMKDGLDKTIAAEELNYKKKIEDAKGNATLIELITQEHRNKIQKIYEDSEKEINAFRKKIHDEIAADLKKEDAEYKKTLEGRVEASEKANDETYNNFLGLADKQKKTDEDITRNTKKSFEERQAALDDSHKKGLISQKDYQDQTQQLQEEGVKKSVTTINNYTQSIGKVANDVMGAIQAFADLAAQKREQEEAAIQKSADTQVSILEAQRNKELAVEGLSQQQKDSINSKYAEQEYQLQLLAYNKETELKKKTFDSDKKLRIVQTVINTITGAVGALTSAMSSALPYPANLIAGLISATAVTAIGVAQVLKIKNQQFDAGTPPTPPGGSAGQITGASGSSTPNPGQNFNQDVVGKASTSASNAAAKQAQQLPPQKVYVTEKDMTATQNKVSVIQQKSTF